MKKDKSKVEPGELPPRQQQAALLLAAGKTLGEVAERVGTSYTTVYRWRRKQEFIAYEHSLVSARNTSFQEHLEGGAIQAVQYLAGVLADPAQPVAVKLKVADSLVNAYIKATPLMERGGKTTETQELMTFLEAMPG